MADGKVEKSELASIAAVCSREGISDSDFKKCLENPESIEFVAPKDDKTRLRYLTDMVLLMMSDGNIDENEMGICKMTAEALGYRHEVIDAMILDIIADLSKKVKNQK
jgi:uncharacterized tellurite resistance protein B-like protein